MLTARNLNNNNNKIEIRCEEEQAECLGLFSFMFSAGSLLLQKQDISLPSLCPLFTVDETREKNNNKLGGENVFMFLALKFQLFLTSDDC